MRGADIGALTILAVDKDFDLIRPGCRTACPATAQRRVRPGSVSRDGTTERLASTGARSVCNLVDPTGAAVQWWKSRVLVCASVMPSSSQASCISSVREDPPGSTMLVTP